MISEQEKDLKYRIIRLGKELEFNSSSIREFVMSITTNTKLKELFLSYSDNELKAFMIKYSGKLYYQNLPDEFLSEHLLKLKKDNLERQNAILNNKICN